MLRPGFRSVAATVLALYLAGCSGVGGSSPAGPAPAPAKEVDGRVVKGNTKFGLDLLNQLRAAEPGKNLFISPASVSLALSMTQSGARGETQQAMLKALSLEGLSSAEVSAANGALHTVLANPDPRVQMSIANSIWHARSHQVSADFQKTVKEFYRAEVQPVDFADQGAAAAMNRWVAKATRDKIPSIVSKTDAMDRMYLINAIYFYGTWKEPFKVEATRPQKFTRADGTAKEHPLMTRQDRFRYQKGENFAAVALPYGEGRLNLYLFLPDEGVGLDRFIQDTTAQRWEEWMGKFTFREGTVSVPKLKLEYSSSLVEPLKALGMGVAFTDRADFSGLFAGNRESLAISSVIHKTFIEMNEKGTEAAAATAVGVAATSAPAPQERFSFIVNRPYLLAIRDDQTGAVLFLGAIYDPA